MLETIDVRATVRTPPRGLHDWNTRRGVRGITTYGLANPPEGVSMASFTQLPDGSRRVRMEANLTTLLYGTYGAAFSLRPSDLAPAISRVMDLQHEIFVGAHVPPAVDQDVHRMDPSMTWDLGEHPVSDIVEEARRVWLAARTSRQVVSVHNSETATIRPTRSRSVSVYDKGADMLRKGHVPPVTSMLRTEARLRPRNVRGAMKWSPTLADLEEIAVRCSEETTAMIQATANRRPTDSEAVVRALLAGGSTVNAALRLSKVIEITAVQGDQAMRRLGVPDKTLERWRAEIRRYLADAGNQYLEPVAGYDPQPMYASDFAVPS